MNATSFETIDMLKIEKVYHLSIQVRIYNNYASGFRIIKICTVDSYLFEGYLYYVLFRRI